MLIATSNIFYYRVFDIAKYNTVDTPKNLEYFPLQWTVDWYVFFLIALSRFVKQSSKIFLNVLAVSASLNLTANIAGLASSSDKSLNATHWNDFSSRAINVIPLTIK